MAGLSKQREIYKTQSLEKKVKRNYENCIERNGISTGKQVI